MSDFKRGCLAFAAGVFMVFGGIWGHAYLQSLEPPAWVVNPLAVTGFLLSIFGIGAAVMGWAYAMASEKRH